MARATEFLPILAGGIVVVLVGGSALSSVDGVGAAAVGVGVGVLFGTLLFVAALRINRTSL